MLPPVRQYVSNTQVRIYRIPCRVMAGLTARVYLLLGAGPPTLVDTGTSEPDCVRDILDGLAEVRTQFGESFQTADIGRILITHAHGDHFGGLAEFADRTGAEVAVHELDRATIEAWDEHAVLLRRRLERLLLEWGAPEVKRADVLDATAYEPGAYRGVPVDRELRDGHDLDGIRPIHTPGHSPGHVCLQVGDLLLTADHVLAQTIPQQWPETLLLHTGLDRYLESLDKVAGVGDVRLALPAHEPIIDDLPHRIRAIRASQRRRLERLTDLMRASPDPVSVDDLADRAYPASRGFRAFLALCDVAARVEYLHLRGRATVVNLDEVRSDAGAALRYRPVR